MADTKISALTGATTPLAGTEVIPVVQGGETRKVSIANLTAGRAISATTVTASIGDITSTAGNFVVGTSGKGIDFSATSHPASMTSELLADYEEGTWTPIYLPETNSFTSITYNIQTGSYTKIGRVVYFSFSLRTASLTIGTATDALRISGLPFTVGGASQSTSLVGLSETWGGDYPSGAFARGGTQLVSMLYRTAANGGTLPIQVSDMSTSASANEISGGGFYIV